MFRGYLKGQREGVCRGGGDFHVISYLETAIQKAEEKNVEKNFSVVILRT
jgi:hypothetical protein